MNEQAAGHVDADDRNQRSGGVGQFELEDVGIERGLHRVVADFPEPGFHRIQGLHRDPQVPQPVNIVIR